MESVKSAEYTYKDARDLVVLAVGYNYLQAIADEARIETAAAQVKTAQALYDQANDRFNSRHFAGDRRVAHESGIANAPAAIDTSAKRSRHPEADGRESDRPCTRTTI